MLDLTPFYNANHIRQELTKPFSDSYFTYATDGHIIIRVPLQDYVVGNPGAPDVSRLFADNPLKIGAQWFAIPDLPDKVTEPCPYCEHGCPECVNGWREKIKSVDIGNGYFQRKYLALLKTLPNCKIAPNGLRKPAWFKFDGGDGFLMPMRERA